MALRRKSRDHYAWRFRPAPVDGARAGGDQAAMSFGQDLEIFVREVLQNSLDARRRDSGEPVKVLFELRELEGKQKKAFLAACGWGDLRAHVEGATLIQPGFRPGLRRLEDPKRPLRLLVVSDRNAVGLGGAEKGAGRFAMFARNKLLSEKQSDDAAGSYGLGKSVLWAFSGISTVLVHSRPEDAQESRFIGVSQLPFHTVGAGEFDGPGWFGVPQSDREEWTVSAWDPARPTLEALGLFRDADWGSGTSIAIPDFRDPEELPIQDLAGQIRAATWKWFWPAMKSDPRWLDVEIEINGQWFELGSDDPEELAPLLHLCDSNPQVALKRETLEGHLPLKIPGVPDHMKDQADFEWHRTTEVGDAFEIALLPVEKPMGNLCGKLALMRGARMVVKYLDLKADQPVYGVVRAGTALGDARENHIVEQFLRTAEPPRHDNWTPDAPNLRQRYKKGAITQLRQLDRKLREEALKLIRGRGQRGRQPAIPKALRKAMSVGSGRTGAAHPRSGRFDFRITDCRLEQREGRDGWAFEGWVHDTHGGPWLLELECGIAGDSGGELLDLEHFMLEGEPQVTPARAFPVEGTGRFAFAGFAALDHLGPLAQGVPFRINLKRSAPRAESRP